MIQRAKAGDADASRVLVDRYRGALASFLYGLTSDESLVEDLAQDTFVRAFSSLGNFKVDGNFRSWLFGIAYHVHVDNLRKRRETPVQGLVEDESQNLLLRVRGRADAEEREETEERINPSSLMFTPQIRIRATMASTEYPKERYLPTRRVLASLRSLMLPTFLTALLLRNLRMMNTSSATSDATSSLE